MPEPIVDDARELKAIRSRARSQGLTIRTRRVSRSGERAFSVLDATTGDLLSSDLPDLEELKNRLWWIVRERRRTETGGAAGEVAKETCPTCGTVRLGSFRFCRSCGMDFEPSRVPAPPPVTATPPTDTGLLGRLEPSAGGSVPFRLGEPLSWRSVDDVVVAPQPTHVPFSTAAEERERSSRLAALAASRVQASPMAPVRSRAAMARPADVAADELRTSVKGPRRFGLIAQIFLAIVVALIVGVVVALVMMVLAL